MNNVKKTSFKKLISLSLLSLVVFAGCKPSSVGDLPAVDPIVSSGVQSAKARGAVAFVSNGERQKTLFQTLIHRKNKIYFEAKQVGIVGFIFGFQQGISTIVIPRENRAVQVESKYPLSVIHDSNIDADLLFSILLYDFDHYFEKAVYKGSQDGLQTYMVPDIGLFHIDMRTGKINRIDLTKHKAEVVFGPWKENTHFPDWIHILEGENQIKWNWKQVQMNVDLPDDWFHVHIPESIVIQ